MMHASKTFALVAFAVLVGALADCSGKTTDENSGPIVASGGGAPTGAGGSAGASSGTGGSTVDSNGGIERRGRDDLLRRRDMRSNDQVLSGDRKMLRPEDAGLRGDRVRSRALRRSELSRCEPAGPQQLLHESGP